MTMKSLFEYDNYREYLRDYYNAKKAVDKKFSFRFFARVVGFKSCGYFKMIMDGQRNIALDSISKISKAIKHNMEETAFFKNLVFLNQAKTADEKQFHAQEILRIRSYRKIYSLKSSQYNYFANWFSIAIREMVSLPDFQEDYDWIGKRLCPAISPGEAKRAVQDLLKLGLLNRRADGKLEQTEINVTTPDEVLVGAVAHYHREMMKRAAESIDTIPREKRDISAVTISISEDTAKRIKEMVQKFRNTIFEIASQESQPHGVYQLNFHFFPLVPFLEDKS